MKRPAPGTRSAHALVAILAVCVAWPARGAESVPPEAAEDARILVENAVAVARQRLAKEGELLPVGVAVKPHGQSTSSL